MKQVQVRIQLKWYWKWTVTVAAPLTTLLLVLPHMEKPIRLSFSLALG